MSKASPKPGKHYDADRHEWVDVPASAAAADPATPMAEVARNRAARPAPESASTASDTKE